MPEVGSPHSLEQVYGSMHQHELCRIDQIRFVVLTSLASPSKFTSHKAPAV